MAVIFVGIVDTASVSKIQPQKSTKGAKLTFAPFVLFVAVVDSAYTAE